MSLDVYLDSASATPLAAEARVAMVEALDSFGDPLNLHDAGRRSRSLIDDSRSIIASSIGAQPDEIVFTSGGTESVALAIFGGVRALRELGTRIVTSAVEHPAVGGIANVLESDGFQLVRIPVDRHGRLDVDAWASEVRRPGTLLASLQTANQELGTIQPVAEAARLAKEAGVRFHSDACQTVGRLPISVRELEVDLLSLSAHKFGGPAGVGALYVKRGVGITAYPCGDDRERKRRSGMENLAGIAAMGAALDASIRRMANTAEVQWRMTGRIRSELASIAGITVHGHPTHRTPHLVSFSVDGVDELTLAMALDDRGFRLGSGSMCSGQPNDPSPVLEAVGHPNTSAFRVGLSEGTTDADIDALLRTLPGLVEELREVETASRAALARSEPPGGGS
jgi:cysteine desulfurase